VLEHQSGPHRVDLQNPDQRLLLQVSDAALRLHGVSFMQNPGSHKDAIHLNPYRLCCRSEALLVRDICGPGLDLGMLKGLSTPRERVDSAHFRTCRERLDPRVSNRALGAEDAVGLRVAHG